MIKLKSNKLGDFAFEDYAQTNVIADLEAVAKSHNLCEFNSWMLPQLLQYFSTWTLIKNDSGAIDPKLTFQRNCTSAWTLGLVRVATTLKRGLLVKKQASEAGANYSRLVPLILAAHKRYNAVGYESWALEPDSPLVEPELLAAMLWRDPQLMRGDSCSLGSDRLLEIRQQGLTVKSGAKAGTILNPQQQWCLRGIKDTELGTVPVLAQTMLTQIWVAHPSLRSELMVLNPYSWDSMPPPLIDTNIFN